MDNIITIPNTKGHVLEFKANIKGLSASSMIVKFIIVADKMELGFNATNIKGENWEVELPPLPMLERTAYPFKICVVSDGYFFEPLTGTANVVGSPDIYMSTPASKQTLKSPITEAEKIIEDMKSSDHTDYIRSNRKTQKQTRRVLSEDINAKKQISLSVLLGDITAKSKNRASRSPINKLKKL